MTESRPLGDVLRDAVLAHREGRLAEAEAGYREILRRRPDEPRTLYSLGLLEFHTGRREEGVQHVLHSLRGDPGNARSWNDLGGMFIAMDRTADAKDAYRRATEAAPLGAEGWFNLGICLRNESNFEGAVSSLRNTIACDAQYARAYEVLGVLLYQIGRGTEAAQVYTDWLSRDPASAKAQHMVAAMSGRAAPSRASDEYLRQLFDDSAESFDTNLQQLEYRAPQAVANALAERSGGGKLTAVLDAGCGTGLCGPLLRGLCSRLVGIDLSQKMVELARARACYDELVVSELTAFLQSQPAVFESIILADTLVYFGALEPVFSAAHASLRGAGWLIFTLEALDPHTVGDYRLQVHGRYAHSESYLREALTDADFQVDRLTTDTFRKEREQGVSGFLVVARKR